MYDFVVQLFVLLILWEILKLLIEKRKGEHMIDALATYNCVSVADLYDLVGMTSNYTDNKYGWYDLRTAYIQGVSGGYVIRLPKPVVLNN